MNDDNLRDMENPLDESPDQGNGTPMGEGMGSASQEIEVVSDDEIEEVPDSIFGGFQIVRSEYFSQLHEPAITFNQGKMNVNSACLKKLPNVRYAQILVNRDQKMLAIRPCQEADIFSFQLLLYLCSDEPDMEKPVRSVRRVSGGFSPPQEARVWDVGVRISRAIRSYRQTENSESSGHGTQHASPRPHVRSAHWHRYWTGPRNSANREMVIHWIPPLPIGMDWKKELPTNIRQVFHIGS